MLKIQKVSIKNMVCPRCVMTVQQILTNAHIPFTRVALGEVTLTRNLNDIEEAALRDELAKVGFEIIDTRINKVVEDIKLAVLEYVSIPSSVKSQNLSDFITERIPNDYSYLSAMFSSAQGKTVERFFIEQRISKVKELLAYDELSLTQIAEKTGYSSVHHLSAQFKKITGSTPSEYKRTAMEKRQGQDQL